MFHSVINVADDATPLFDSVLLDPLDPDCADDLPLVVTKRRLTRVALIASEVGARFQREGLEFDPMAWMLAPRELFGGGAAIDACLEQNACMRALLVHGLGLGLDASPEAIDALLDHGEAGDVKETDSDDERDLGFLPRDLYTAILVDEQPASTRFVFAAILAASDEHARRTLGVRLGLEEPARLEIARGFDPSRPVATALLSDAIAEMLSQAAVDPSSPLAQGLDVVVEQRFAA